MATFIRLRSKTTGDWLVHPKLRDHLIKDASREGTNMTDVIVRILSDRYKTPYESGGRTTNPGNSNDVINLGDALPKRLERAIKMAAARDSGTWIDRIRADLCEHYGLKIPVKKAKTRRRAA
jgi:hypothetical protein